MTKTGIAKLAGERASLQLCRDFPLIPSADNEPGAPKALLKANKLFRTRRWPPPYDRTQHEIVLGDARDLRFIRDELVHLVVTSPPYFNLKPYASDADGRQLGRVEDYELFLGELDRVLARMLARAGSGRSYLLRDRRYSDSTARRWSPSRLAVALRHPGSQPQTWP